MDEFKRKYPRLIGGLIFLTGLYLFYAGFYEAFEKMQRGESPVYFRTVVMFAGILCALSGLLLLVLGQRIAPFIYAETEDRPVKHRIAIFGTIIVATILGTLLLDKFIQSYGYSMF